MYRYVSGPMFCCIRFFASTGQGEAETDERKRGFKRPSLHFTDRKALRAIRVEERRRGVRDNIHSERRGINRYRYLIRGIIGAEEGSQGQHSLRAKGH
jgi:hypothetical protein